MTYKILIAGEMIDSAATLDIINPTDNSVAGEIPLLPANELVNNAMEAAHNAFGSWKNLPWETRAKYLLRFRDLLLEKKEELADILTKEIAKNKKESLVEVERSAQYIDDTIAIYEKIYNSPLVIKDDVHHIKGKTGKFSRIPLGVVLAISPFNYPVNLLISKLAPALIAGNTVVYKPATQGSLVGAKISELFYKAEFPSGVVNCVVGKGKEIGDLLVTHKHVAMISFTGSANIGNGIAKLAPRIPLVLELGGKDPAIVLNDANLELTASEIVKGALSYNGQRCTAIKRVLVLEEVHDELVKLIVDKTKQLTIGLPEHNCDITSVISSSSAKYTMSLVNDAIKKGAEAQTPIHQTLNLINPVILTNVTTDMDIAWDEPFGPVLPIIKCKDVKECIDIANQSVYGLQASVFTQNTALGEQIADQLDCGTVNINRSSSRGPDIFPFLGVKDSGFGVQGLEDAILSMTRIKGVVFNK